MVELRGWLGGRLDTEAIIATEVNVRLQGLANCKNMGCIQSVLSMWLHCLISPWGYEVCSLFIQATTDIPVLALKNLIHQGLL